MNVSYQLNTSKAWFCRKQYSYKASVVRTTQSAGKNVSSQLHNYVPLGHSFPLFVMPCAKRCVISGLPMMR